MEIGQNLPMDIAWLRVRCRDCLESVANKKGEVDGESRSWFRRGGYVEHLFESGVEDDLMPRIWKIAIGVPPARPWDKRCWTPPIWLSVPVPSSKPTMPPMATGFPSPDVFLETTKHEGKRRRQLLCGKMCVMQECTIANNCGCHLAPRRDVATM
jgi:hypothetical protein